MQKQKPIRVHVPKFLNPKKILSQAGITQDMKVIDLGCGSGYMAFEAARLVGPSGVVYAVDIQKPVLSSVRSNIQFYGLRNVKPVWADIEKPGTIGIEDNSLDMVLIIMNLYQARQHDAILSESYKMLKPEGRLLIVDWKRESIPLGPDVKFRISYDVANKIAQNAGFKFVSDIETDPYHFGILFKK